MTHDRNDSGAYASRGLFASGMVLGLSLGLVCGHLLLFARKAHDPAETKAADEFPSFDPSGFVFGADPDVEVPDDISFSIVEFGESQKVGRAKVSDRDDDEPLHFFPEAVSLSRPLPWTEVENQLDTDKTPLAERTSLASADEIESDRPLSRTAELNTPTQTPPQALQPLPGAAPIDERTLQSQQLARTIIDEELPDATPQERDVWCEVLQGLPAEDIKGILRMRKHIGPRNPFPAISVLSPLAPHRRAEPSEAQLTLEDESADSPKSTVPSDDPVDLQIARISRHNRANRDTVGYKSLVPVLVETPWDDANDRPATRISRVVRDMTPGKLLHTGRLLDVAVDGNGYLQVRLGDEVRYTRDGRLSLDEAGRLKLLTQLEDWLLDPPVVVPPEATELTIAEDGQVTVTVAGSAEPSEIGSISLQHFINPETLQVDATGLLEPTSETGLPHQLPLDAFNAGSLVQGHLEASNAGDEPVAGRISDPSVR